MPKIIIITSSSLYVVQHLEPIIKKLKRCSELYLICPYDPKYKIIMKGLKVIYIPLKRNPSWIDLISLIITSYHRIIISPWAVLSFTAKGGALNSFTYLLPGKTIHYFTGLRWVLFKGLKRKFFKFFDHIIIKFSDLLYCDAFSQSNFIAKELNTLPPKVIGSGSLSGVNLSLYNLPKDDSYNALLKSTKSINKKLNNLLIDKKNKNKNKPFLFGFVGRIAKDKGILDLIAAFREHQTIYPNSHLIIIGPQELDYEFQNQLNYQNILYLGFKRNLYLYYNCLDTLVLPSYREGFGSVLLEAAASSLPIISTNVDGPRDFIRHKINGYLVEPKNVKSLKKALDYFRENKSELKKYAMNALEIVNEKYNVDYVSNLFVKDLLSQ